MAFSFSFQNGFEIVLLRYLDRVFHSPIHSNAFLRQRNIIAINDSLQNKTSSPILEELAPHSKPKAGGYILTSPSPSAPPTSPAEARDSDLLYSNRRSRYAPERVAPPSRSCRSH